MRRTLVLLLLPSFLALSHTAFSSGDALEGKRISSLKVISRTGMTKENLSDIIQIRAGDLYSTAAIKKSLELIFQGGTYRDVLIDAEETSSGVIVTYTLLEKIIISSVRITGHQRFPAKRILEAIKISVGDEYSPAQGKEVLSRLSDFYKSEGFFESSATLAATVQQKESRAIISITINEGERARIREIHFPGERELSDFSLLSVMKSRNDSFYRSPLVEMDIKALEGLYTKRGYLKAVIGPPEVIYHRETHHVSLTLPIEAGIRLKTRFEGNRSLSSRTLEKHTAMNEERSFEESVLLESARRIEDYYRSRGYLFVTVEAIRRDDPDKKEVEALFHIKEGKRVRLKRISFQGNRFFSQRDIKKLLKTKEAAFFSFRSIDQEALQDDHTALLDLYKRAGFLHIKIQEEISYNAEKTKASLAFIVDEGVQTIIQRIQMEGNTAFSEEMLRKKMQVKTGVPYNEALAEEDRVTVLSFYFHKGFLYAHVDLSTSITDEGRTAVLSYKITEDNPVTVGNILVKGNTFTKGKVVTRELLIHSGDLYDYDKILKSQIRLSRLGYFSGVRLEPSRPEVKEYVKDVLLSVTERKAGAIEFGLGYGDEERFRGTLELSHKNIAGTGRRISLRGEGSSIGHKAALTYTEPWLFGWPMDARTGGVYQREERLTFTQRTLGGTVGIDKSFSAATKGSILYQYEFNKFEEVEPQSNCLDVNNIQIGSLSASLIRDSRDDPFNPQRGAVNGIILKDGALALGSELQFIKVTLQNNFFLPLGKRGVLAFSGRGGMVERFGVTTLVPCSEVFFLGGRSTVRGYERDSLGVPGETSVNGRPTGGNAMLLLNAELRLSLPGRLGLVFFLDSGNVWITYQDVTLRELKSSTGAGLRYNTLVGPLRLDYGQKLDREAGESRGEVHFTLGHAF